MSTNISPAVETPKSWCNMAAFWKNASEYEEKLKDSTANELNDYIATGRLLYKNPVTGLVEEAHAPSRSIYLRSPLQITSNLRFYAACKDSVSGDAHGFLQNYVLYRELCSIQQFLVEVDFPERFGKKRRGFSIKDSAGAIGVAAAIGAIEVLDRWAPLIVEAMVRGYAADDEYHGIHHFILRLWCAARGRNYPEGKYPRYEVAEKVLQMWDSPEGDSLGCSLKQICDHHAQLSKSQDMMDFRSELSHFPAEILMLFRLRDQIGLPNPSIEHPIMKFSWSRLWEIAIPQPESQLLSVYQRLAHDEDISIPSIYSTLLPGNLRTA